VTRPLLAQTLVLAPLAALAVWQAIRLIRATFRGE
jgi:hypothetical protein